jgi:hypothetical protein
MSRNFFVSRRFFVLVFFLVLLTGILNGCGGKKSSNLSFDFPTDANAVNAFTNSETFGMAITA